MRAGRFKRPLFVATHLNQPKNDLLLTKIEGQILPSHLCGSVDCQPLAWSYQRSNNETKIR
jgi:hypothetical protein